VHCISVVRSWSAGQENLIGSQAAGGAENKECFRSWAGRADLDLNRRAGRARAALLNDYNLNAFSLFDSEETLLETMWFREHVLKPRHLAWE
jgi:hypothetical protein